MAAITNNGSALRHAAPEFQRDKKTMLVALESDWMALENASSHDRADKLFILEAVRVRPSALNDASAEIQAICKDVDPVKALQSAILSDKLTAQLKPKVEQKRAMKI